MVDTSNFWKLKICEFKKVNIFFHLTTCLFIAWLCYEALFSNSEFKDATFTVLLAFYSAILSREIPRLLLLKKLNANLQKITIYPLCFFYAFRGVFSTKKALLYAVSGVATNLFFALLFYKSLRFDFLLTFQNLDFVAVFANFSFLLAVIHILPIYPFDGMFFLRHLSNVKTSEKNMHKALALEFLVIIILCALSIYMFSRSNVEFLILTLLLIFPAFQNRSFTKLALLSNHYTCEEAMFSFEKMIKIPHNISARMALELALKTPQDIFPVFNGEVLLGIIQRTQIISSGLSLEDSYISEAVDREYQIIDAKTSLTKALFMFNEKSSPIVVKKEHSFLGVITPVHLQEFTLIKGTLTDIQNTKKNFYDEI